MTTIHTGSCLCGAVQFEMEGEFKKFFLCHCSRCRKISGSAHCANLFAPGAKLRWLSGKNKLSLYRHEGANFSRQFCSICSSTMPLHIEARDIVVMPAGCLDNDIDIKPQAHIFTDSKGNWDDILNDTPTFETMPV
jgi:hypothetical protein